MLPAYFCHVCHLWKYQHRVYWILWYSSSILKVTFLKSNPFRFKETLISFNIKKNGTTRKRVQSDTVLREMLIEATFNQTNFWFIFFSILGHKVWVLIYNMFIFEKVGHSKFVEMHGDTSDFFQSASKSNRYFFLLLIAIYL